MSAPWRTSCSVTLAGPSRLRAAHCTVQLYCKQVLPSGTPEFCWWTCASILIRTRANSISNKETSHDVQKQTYRLPSHTRGCGTHNLAHSPQIPTRTQIEHTPARMCAHSRVRRSSFTAWQRFWCRIDGQGPHLCIENLVSHYYDIFLMFYPSSWIYHIFSDLFHLTRFRKNASLVCQRATSCPGHFGFFQGSGVSDSCTERDYCSKGNEPLIVLGASGSNHERVIRIESGPDVSQSDLDQIVLTCAWFFVFRFFCFFLTRSF